MKRGYIQALLPGYPKNKSLDLVLLMWYIFGVRCYGATQKSLDVMRNSLVKSLRDSLITAKLPFRLLGAIVFGSTVKNQATGDSDVDLLVVAEDINPKLHRRGEEIAAIKRALPPFPFDILLYTREEVVSNFRNHNPLFLDIADEGVILFDDHDFLEDLMHETREYIKQSGIKKLDDGWSFPVRPGVATPLSKVSNKDFSEAMLEDGRRDYIIGTKLLAETIYDKAVYHFQQSIEKSIKSIFIATGIFKKTHYVGEILRSYVQQKKFPPGWEDRLREAAEISERMEPEVSLSRYPGIIDDSLWLPSEEYEEEDAERAMKNSERVLEVAKEFTSDWFSG